MPFGPELQALLDQGDEKALVLAVAHTAAHWVALGGDDARLARQISRAACAASPDRTGMLVLAGLDLIDLLGSTPNGREALRDLGFEPVAQHLEGE